MNSRSLAKSASTTADSTPEDRDLEQIAQIFTVDCFFPTAAIGIDRTNCVTGFKTLGQNDSQGSGSSGWQPDHRFVTQSPLENAQSVNQQFPAKSLVFIITPDIPLPDLTGGSAARSIDGPTVTKPNTAESSARYVKMPGASRAAARSRERLKASKPSPRTASRCCTSAAVARLMPT